MFIQSLGLMKVINFSQRLRFFNSERRVIFFISDNIFLFYQITEARIPPILSPELFILFN